MASSKKTNNQENNFKKTYLRLIKYAYNYKSIILLSLFSLLGLGASNTAFLALIKKITDEGMVARVPDSASYLIIFLIVLIIIRGTTGFISSYSLRWVSRKIVEDLRFDLFKNIMSLPSSFFDKNSAGNIVSKLTYETEQLSMIVIKVSLDAFRDIFTLIGVVGYMIYLDWKLTLFFMCTVPIISVYLKQISPKLKKTGSEVQKTMGDMTRVAEEAISGQRIVKIFNSKKYELGRFSFFSIRNRKMQTKLAQLSSGNSFFVEIITGLAFTFVVYYSINNLSVGGFAAFVAALLMLITPIKKLTSINEQIQVGYAAALSIFEIMDEEKELESGVRNIKKIKGEIELRDISFSYSDDEKKVLKNINIKIKPGEKIALVGKSGSGKSTLINLLPFFYKAQHGEIFLDNLNINKYRLSVLRDQISLVSQEIILFNDSIYKNISYGKKYNIKDVIKSARAANADEFIQKLSNKYDHIIGDRGVKLSGGQKQRIAIARALLKNAPILLLDEATSSLDSESEKLVQDALHNLMKKRTSIIVAHRLSTIINADRIIVLNEGSIHAVGTHMELLKSNMIYKRLYKKGFNKP